MILANVNIGTGPSAGDGDPLRSAFSAINNNFQIITNNVNALTNSVTTVAGRTGNVVLTVNDIIGWSSVVTQANIDAANTAMKSYVDGQIAAANTAGGYSNVNTLAYLTTNSYATQTYVNLANTAMKSYVDGQITAANTASGYSNVNTLAYLTTNSYATQSYVNLANTSLKNYVDGQITASNTSANTSQLWNSGYTLSVASSNGNVTLPRGTILGAVGTASVFKPAASGTLELRSDNGYNRVQVNDTDVTIFGGDSHWRFDYYGKLTLPSGANITAYVDGITTIRDGEGVEIEIDVNNGFKTRADTGTRVLANGHSWIFGLDGSITFPDTTVQTTAWDGTIDYANVTNAYSNVQVAQYLPAYTGNIGGDITVGGKLIVSSANSAPFTNADALYIVGGITSGANISAGGRLVACSFARSTNINSGAIQTNGGIGAWGNIYAGENIVATGNVSAAHFIGNLIFPDNSIQTTAYINSVNTAAISANVLTLDFNLSTQIVTHDANISNVAIANGPGNLTSKSMTVILSQDATGGRTISGYYKTQDGLGLDIDTTALAVNIYTFLAVNDGSNTNLYAFSNGTNFI